MVNSSKIQEHMDVVGSDGRHVGTVDSVEGNRIKLTKNDSEAQGHHHYIPQDWIQSVEQHAIRLNKTSGEARQQWQAESQPASDVAAAGGGATGSADAKGGNGT